MQQRQQTQTKRQRLFSASELAEFEYCPLVWWHEEYEPLARVDTEDLFARLVELEHENGSQAPALPEYQMVEQLLLRKGAFDEGQQQHLEHSAEVEEVQEELVTTTRMTGKLRALALVAIVILVLALALIGTAILLR